MKARWIGWAVPLLVLVAGSQAMAQEAAFRCPLDAFTVYRDPGFEGDLIIALRSGEPGTVELHGPWGDLSLPANKVSFENDVVFGDSTGIVEMPMPDRAAIDACIAEREKENPRIMQSRQDEEVLTTCRNQAPLSGPVAVNLSVSIMAMDPSQATAIIKRAYADEEGEAARRHRADSMATCTPMEP